MKTFWVLVALCGCLFLPLQSYAGDCCGCENEACKDNAKEILDCERDCQKDDSKCVTYNKKGSCATNCGAVLEKIKKDKAEGRNQ